MRYKITSHALKGGISVLVAFVGPETPTGKMPSHSFSSAQTLPTQGVPGSFSKPPGSREHPAASMCTNKEPSDPTGPVSNKENRIIQPFHTCSSSLFIPTCHQASWNIYIYIMNLYDHVASGRPHGFRMVGPDPSLLHSRIVALDMMLSHHACLSRVRTLERCSRALTV